MTSDGFRAAVASTTTLELEIDALVARVTFVRNENRLPSADAACDILRKANATTLLRDWLDGVWRRWYQIPMRPRQRTALLSIFAVNNLLLQRRDAHKSYFTQDVSYVYDPLITLYLCVSYLLLQTRYVKFWTLWRCRPLSYKEIRNILVNNWGHFVYVITRHSVMRI